MANVILREVTDLEQAAIGRPGSGSGRGRDARAHREAGREDGVSALGADDKKGATQQPLTLRQDPLEKSPLEPRFILNYSLSHSPCTNNFQQEKI